MAEEEDPPPTPPPPPPPPVCCPECGAVLSSGRLDGLCPVCLLEETDPGLDEPEEPPPQSGPGLLHLSGYRIIREVARGGMGIIYEAEEAEPLRRVAVKMLLPHLLENPGMRERFSAEVQAMAGLDHPGILPVYKVGDYNGLPYFTMKLAPGGNLAKKAAELQGEWRSIATLVAGLADAIQTAHEYGVLHRDLKPANILFDEKDRPCVSDFGIAKMIHEDEEGLHLTKSATVLGTPNYLPPEWASGSAKRASTAGDIYGLGAILYELLTGSPPHTDTHLTALLRQIADEPVTTPRSINPKVPRDLETICLKAVSKDPHNRYSSATALAEDLRNWLDGRPIQARPVNGMEKLWRWARRNPLPAGLAATLALALTLGGAALTQSWRTSRIRLHDALLAQAAALRESGKLGNQDEALDALTRAAAIRPSAAVRDEFISALSMTGLRETHSMSYGPPAATERVYTDATLTLHTYRDEKGVITVRRIPDGTVVSTVPSSPGDPEIYGPVSPDGRFLFVRPRRQPDRKSLRDMPLHIWDIQDSTWRRRDLRCFFACFSPDNRTVALGSVDGTVSFFDLLEGGIRGPCRTGFDRQVRPYCFSPDGKKLLVGQSGEVDPADQGRQTFFEILDTETGKSEMRRQHPSGAKVRCAAWRPDGQSVFIGTENFRIYEWLMIPDSLPRQYAGHHGNILTLEVDRGGDTLISQSDDRTTRLWSVGSTGTLAVIPVYGSEAHFSTNGDRFLCEDRAARMLRTFDLVPSEVCREFSVPYPLGDGVGSSGCWRIIFSPDGGLLTVGDLYGMLHFDGLTGVPVGVGPEDPCWSLQWMADGSRLFSVSEDGVQAWPARKMSGGGAVLDPALPAWIGPGNRLTLDHCSLSGDNRTLAVGRRKHLELFDTSSGQVTRTLGEVDECIDAVAMNSDGSLTAVSQENHNGIQIWDTASGQELEPIVTRFPQGTVLFAREPDILYMGTQDELSCRDVRTGEERWRKNLPSRSPVSVQLAFPADFSLLAASLTPDAVWLLDPVSGREIATIRHASPHPISALAFSPDGTRLAVFCVGHIVQLWDLPKLRALLARQKLDWDAPPSVASPSRVWRAPAP